MLELGKNVDKNVILGPIIWLAYLHNDKFVKLKVYDSQLITAVIYRSTELYSTDPMSYFHSRVRLSFKRGKKRKISGIDKHLQQKFSDKESFFFSPKLD